MTNQTVMDADGAVAIAAADVTKVLDAARARIDKEARMREWYRAGELGYDIHGLRERENG